MLDILTKQLFGSFPRDVSDPSRRSIFSEEQLEDFVLKNNFVNDCFTSIYNDSSYDENGNNRLKNGTQIPENEITIDKAFMDFDNKIGNGKEISMRQVLEEAQLVAKWLVAKGFQIIPVASGKKGIHFHILLRPKTYQDPKTLLRSFTTYVLNSASDVKLISFDTRVIGDIRRICRIPNTARPNLGTFCTYIPLLKFLKFNENDLIYHIKRRTFVDSPIYGKIDQTMDEYRSLEDNHHKNRYNSTGLVQVLQTRTVENRFLKSVLRPCLYSSITDKDPRHHIRVAATIDLLGAGFSESQIISTYSTLGWVDFDFEKTSSYVRGIAQKNYQSYSCAKLREQGLKNNGRCCF